MSEGERVARFVDGLREDPRVLGVARLREHAPGVPRLLVVTTWDGLAALTPLLPLLGSPLLAPGPRIEQVEKSKWTGIDSEGGRAEIELRRAGDLVPTRDGIQAEPLLDPRGVLEQWFRCCGNEQKALTGESKGSTPLELAIGVDWPLRFHEAGRITTYHDSQWLRRSVRNDLRPDQPAEAALAARIDRGFAAEPHSGEGIRAPASQDPAAALEAFLRIADGEGFRGDRVLFGEAVKRLRDLAKREPVFDQGFVVPTFDAVEAGFALGDAVGGCQPPLVPGVWVGVGVTPTDALEFWAAPFVRDPTCTVACVDDLGDRDVVLRSAGRGPMVASLTTAIDAAWDRLPALIDRARDAAKESVDPAAVLATLHLPRSFVERAKRRGADALMCSRLTVALAVARAGNDCAPLVARKFGLAAGRVVAAR